MIFFHFLKALAKVDKAVAASFREKKDYILVQQVERRWSNTNANNIEIMEPPAGINPKPSKRNQSQTSRFSYQHQRTKSLCVFYNTSILNYARAMAENNKKNSTSGSSNKVTNGSSKDMRILQMHEKIMEVQNKWTGNGRFILREKNTFLVI